MEHFPLEKEVAVVQKQGRTWSGKKGEGREGEREMGLEVKKGSSGSRRLLDWVWVGFITRRGG